MSDTVFRNRSQQGGLRRAATVSRCLHVAPAEMKHGGITRGGGGAPGLLWVSSVVAKAGVILQIPTLPSHLTPSPSVSLTSDVQSCATFANLSCTFQAAPPDVSVI